MSLDTKRPELSTDYSIMKPVGEITGWSWSKMAGWQKVLFGFGVFAAAYYKAHKEEIDLELSIRDLRNEKYKLEQEAARKRHLSCLRETKMRLEDEIAKLKPPQFRIEP